MKKLILIPLGLPWEWLADYEKETARYLARRHVVIVFLIGQGISLRRYMCTQQTIVERVSKNLYIFRPLYLLPFQRFSAIRTVNFRIASYFIRLWIACSPWKRYKKVYWSFSLQYAVFPSYFGTQYFSIYDCVDAFVTEKKTLRQMWKRYEEKIMKESMLVLVNSSTLFNQKKHMHPHVFQTAEGLFAHEIYSSASSQKEPGDLSSIPHPRIIFIGNINKRLDFTLIKNLATSTPRYSYIFVGREDSLFDGHSHINFSGELNRLKNMTNIYFLGEKPKSAIPAYIQHSDVGFIPYDISLQFNQLCYPMKIQEYFYVGKPVLCTAITEVKRLAPYITVFYSSNDARQKLQILLSHPWPKQYRQTQRRIAIDNSIENKVHLVETILRTHFPNRF